MKNANEVECGAGNLNVVLGFESGAGKRKRKCECGAESGAVNVKLACFWSHNLARKGSFKNYNRRKGPNTTLENKSCTCHDISGVD